MKSRDEEIEELHDTVRELTSIVKELRETNQKREAQVKKALVERVGRIEEVEKQELYIYMTILVSALVVEIILFIILLVKM